jgi:hypothetical protein
MTHLQRKSIPLNQSECIFTRNSHVQMVLCAILLCSFAHSIICTCLFHVKMHSDWFNRIVILQGRLQNVEKAGYCYPSGLEKTLCKWDIYVPLVTKGLRWRHHTSKMLAPMYHITLCHISKKAFFTKMLPRTASLWAENRNLGP